MLSPAVGVPHCHAAVHRTVEASHVEAVPVEPSSPPRVDEARRRPDKLLTRAPHVLSHATRPTGPTRTRTRVASRREFVTGLHTHQKWYMHAWLACSRANATIHATMPRCAWLGPTVWLASRQYYLFMRVGVLSNMCYLYLYTRAARRERSEISDFRGLPAARPRF